MYISLCLYAFVCDRVCVIFILSSFYFFSCRRMDMYDVHAHTHIYIYIYIYIYILNYNKIYYIIYVYASMYIFAEGTQNEAYVCMYVCMNLKSLFLCSLSVCLSVYMYACVYIINTLKYVYIDVFTHKNIYIYTYIRTYIHTYTHES
jgi:hypothetical protein